MRHVALDVHLRLFPLRRRGQGRNAKHARTGELGNRANDPALARRVASLKDDDDLRAGLLHPFLQLDQFHLQRFKQRVILFAL